MQTNEFVLNSINLNNLKIKLKSATHQCIQKHFQNSNS